MRSFILIMLLMIVTLMIDSVQSVSVRRPCFATDCGPRGKRVDAGLDETGCPIIACVDICRPFLVQCPNNTRAVDVGKDEKGCPKALCAVCPTIECPPDPHGYGPGRELVGVDEFGCETYR